MSKHDLGNEAAAGFDVQAMEDGHPSSDEDTLDVEVVEDNLDTTDAERAKLEAGKGVNADTEEAWEILNMTQRTPWAERPLFCAIVGIEVVANVLVLALEADFKCYHNCKESDFFIWWVLDQVFTIFAILDVVVAFVSLGPARFLQGDPGTANQAMIPGMDSFRYFDVLVVLSRCADTWVLPSVGIKDSGLKLVSAFRIVHIGRSFKHVKSIQAFRELWLIMEGLKDTMKCVAFVTGLLVIILLVFGVWITMMVGKVDKSQFDFKARGSSWDKDDYWGSVPKSMFSLFQVLTRDRWSEGLVRPLVERSPSTALFFVCFVVIGILAALSTIVGVVVESTLASAATNEEKIRQEKQKLEEMVMKSLEDIFREADEDESGDLSREELSAALKKPHVIKRMRILEIAIGDLDLLFSLLDSEDRGVIKTGSFFKGCTRLRGPAMARDLNQMGIDLVRHVQWVDDTTSKIENMNESMSTLLDILDTVDRDVVQDPASDAKDPVLTSRRNRVRVKRADYLCKAVRRSSTVFVQPTLALEPGSRATTKTTKVSQRNQESPFLTQPPPPPLPEHLRELKN